MKSLNRSDAEAARACGFSFLTSSMDGSLGCTPHLSPYSFLTMPCSATGVSTKVSPWMYVHMVKIHSKDRYNLKSYSLLSHSSQTQSRQSFRIFYGFSFLHIMVCITSVCVSIPFYFHTKNHFLHKRIILHTVQYFDFII